MNAEVFVDAVRLVVQKASARGVISNLEHPPGRTPAPELISLAAWYALLDESDREQVKGIAMMAAHAATFGFLAVLDHVHVIEDGPDQGDLELYYVKDGERTLLNNPNGPLLHELL